MTQSLRQNEHPRFLLLDIAGHLGFLFLAVLAIIFYAERMFADASYYLLHVINRGWFYIEHGRLVLTLSEILPLLGVHAGIPMKGLLVLFFGWTCSLSLSPLPALQVQV